MHHDIREPAAVRRKVMVTKRRRGEGRLSRALIGSTVVIILVFLIAPLFIVIPMSFSSALSLEFPPRTWSVSYYLSFFTSERWISAAVNTVIASLVSSVVATVVATFAALALVNRRLRLKNLFWVFLMLPLVTPIIVIAVSDYRTFVVWGLANSVWGLSIVYTCLTIPFVLMSVAAALRDFDDRQRLAALSLGASPAIALVRVVVPQLLGAIIAGWFVAAVYAFNETVVAIFLVSGDGATLPKRMWDGIILGVDPTISVVATLMTVVTVIALILQTVLSRRRGGHVAMGRAVV